MKTKLKLLQDDLYNYVSKFNRASELTAVALCAEELQKAVTELLFSRARLSLSSLPFSSHYSHQCHEDVHCTVLGRKIEAELCFVSGTG